MDHNLFRSAQIYGKYITPLLRLHAIATVVNLRGANPRSRWYNPEKSLCEELGIWHVDHSLHSRRLPKQEILIDLLETFNNAPRPLLIKCSGGADRTGLAAAIFLLNEWGVNSIPQAVKQISFLPYLHLPRQNQKWIKHFPSFFASTHNGVSLCEWIKHTYSTELFSSWLCQNELKGTWFE
ncbi:MAG: hypothetical protein CMM58_11720 [Rhodospirillaceae bacterium]|nr:hypothetical protein [Rhodospirillaceae bacterium]